MTQTDTTIAMCEHFVNGVIIGHPRCWECPTQERLNRLADDFLAAIAYRKAHPKKLREEGYEFWRHYQE